MARRCAAILERFAGHVQLGGGIRTRESIERWLDLGVARVVIGTAALENPDLVRDGRATIPGGSSSPSTPATAWSPPVAGPTCRTSRVIDLARRFEDAGVAALLFTDVGRDGLLKGCNVEATVALARAVVDPRHRLWWRHRDRRHPCARAATPEDGIEGVITGRALYDGRLDLELGDRGGEGMSSPTLLTLSLSKGAAPHRARIATKLRPAPRERTLVCLPRMTVRARVIPCLDVAGGRVVKGVNFVDLRRCRRSGRAGPRL